MQSNTAIPAALGGRLQVKQLAWRKPIPLQLDLARVQRSPIDLNSASDALLPVLARNAGRGLLA